MRENLPIERHASARGSNAIARIGACWISIFSMSLGFVFASEARAETEPITFSSDLGFPGVNLETGFFPDDSFFSGLPAKLQARAFFVVDAQLFEIDMPGVADFDGSRIGVVGDPLGGQASMDMGIEYGAEVLLHIPIIGVNNVIFDVPGLPSIDLTMNDSVIFTPFLLDSSVQLSDFIPATLAVDADLTGLLCLAFPPFCPFEPFTDAGVMVQIDGDFQETFRGDNIVFSPGGTLNSESSSLPFSGGSSTLSYNGNLTASLEIGFTPCLFVGVFGVDVDTCGLFGELRLPVNVPLGDLNLAFDTENVFFAPLPCPSCPPDLIITSGIAVTPVTVMPGDTVNVSQITIQNAGEQETGPFGWAFSTGYYLSTDSTIDPSDDERLSEGVGHLDPGESFTHSSKVLTIPAGTPPGDYWIGYFVDDTDVVEEQFELTPIFRQVALRIKM